MLMALCDARFSATQFALLSALSVLGRVYLGPVAGFTVEYIDWTWFFVLTFLAALPGLWLLWALRDRIRQLDHLPNGPEGGHS